MLTDRPIFRNFKIANIKMTKDELFDNFIFEFNFSLFRNHLNTQNFNNFSSCEILIVQMVELNFFHFLNR